MKNEKLLNAIGKIDDELIYNAVNDSVDKKAKCFPKWAKWSSTIAACLVLAIVCVTLLPNSNDAGDESPSQGGGSGHEEGTVFMSYAGPVFPLTLIEKNNGLEASRKIDYNFSTYLKDREDVEVWGNNGGGSTKRAILPSVA